MPAELISRSEAMHPSSTDPTFVQQGAVDWLSLSKTVVSMSVGTLAGLSSAGVQTITYVGALQLATRFKLANIGDRRVHEAANSLRFARAFDDVAYFGFGYQSFVRILLDSVSGTKCVALCASLSEAHSEELAARIISSLWEAVGYPEDYQPSLPQFRCLVKACAGVFAKSTFHETMRLMLGSYRDFLKKGKLPEASDPRDIARVLQAVFDVSKSLREKITVVGGAECSFIAAISLWLFDLKIHVEDSQGNTLFQSSPSADQTQVHIVYGETDQLHPTRVSNSSFKLGGPRELLRYVPDSRLRLVRTRVPWNSCLGYTFGQDFKDLLSLSEALGWFIGGATRIWQALAKGEPGVDVFSRELFIDFVEASYGRGFITSMTSLFPELSGSSLLASAEAGLSRDVSGAVSAIEEAMLAFKRQCMCCRCCPTVTMRENYDDAERLCLTVLAATIFDLVVTLSSVECQGLQPTENGLYHVYEKNRRAWREAKAHQGVQAFAETSGLHERQGAPSIKSPSTIMADTICLFTGYELTRPELNTYTFRTAAAENGICVYMDCLESMTTRPELLRRVHVIPGYIGRGNRSFDSVWDCAPTEAPFLEGASFRTTSNDPDASPSHGPLEQLTITPLVDEPGGPGQLALYYRISAPQGRIFIQPGAMSSYILSRSGLIVCKKADCDERYSSDPYFIHAGWNFNDESLHQLSQLRDSRHIPARSVFVWKHANSTTARLLALEMQRQFSIETRAQAYVLLAQDKCLPCSVRAATQLETKHTHPSDRVEHLIHIL